MKTKLMTGRRLSALALCVVTLGASAVSAQSDEYKVIPMSRLVGLVNQSNKLHRFIDEELGVACYAFSDGRTPPSCVALRSGAGK